MSEESNHSISPNGELIPKTTEAMAYENQVLEWLKAFPRNEELTFLMFFHCTIVDTDLETNHTVQNIDAAKADQRFAFQCFKALTNQFMDGIK